MRRAKVCLLPLALGLVAAPVCARYAAHVSSNPELGKAEGRCRAGEPGPALLIEVAGLKDRKGLVKAEVYPPDDDDFLADDDDLVNAGKVFRRVEEPVPARGPVVLCIRVPAPGSYSLLVLHDRDSNHKFSWWGDGVGFAGNPKIGWHKPPAEDARIVAGPGLTRTTVVMNYRRGLGVAPLRHPHGSEDE